MDDQVLTAIVRVMRGNLRLAERQSAQIQRVVQISDLPTLVDASVAITCSYLRARPPDILVAYSVITDELIIGRVSYALGIWTRRMVEDALLEELRRNESLVSGP